ncbi:formylglycine-generating enzyme family protein [Candidatus Electronema sp. JM]|uniref:formylglycine-generating enzyme family protein n=1 Tax=Candidatus Electronema sp. JM TaxID=3401571 RepID=UPI003AA871BE
MSRPGTVSRADLLRLLAACPDAPLAAAAQLAGWPSQPESPAAVQAEVTEGYETAPAALRLSPQERFWQLRSRELLPSRSNRAQSLLPAELRQLRPLREKELRRAAPLPSVPPHSRQAAALLQAAVQQRPLRFAPVENHPEPVPASAVLAQELLRSSAPLDRNQAEWLDHFLLRLIRTWFDRRKDADLLACARDLLDVLPEDFRSRQDSAALLYGLAQRDALRKGAIIPPEYRPEAVLATAQEPLPPSTWLLIQEGEALFLLNSPDSGICLLKGSRLAALTLDSDILLLRRNGQTATAPVQTLLPLALLSGLEQLAVQSRTERLHLQTCVRPAWAVLIGRNSRELFAEVPWLGRAWRLRWQVTGGIGGWSSGHGPVCADRFGISAYIGFYGRVMQLFRWLDPGRFWMGSPPNEPEREAWGKETQHEVTLSNGFWLADTTVSQELWQFVMRSNPSRFLGRELPVDSVSWEDAQLFLQRLNAMVPGLAARLPTEAEWEYACRAGTTTPFAFGSQISSEQVNCNASCPYRGSAKGLFRRQTIAVGSLPANAWGLHEMHGNLWEWCQDWWQEDLGGDAVLDPHGPQQGEFRAVRGGSWFLSGRAVRSAVRGRFAPNFRNDRLGFRIARDHELKPADTAAAVPEITPAAPPSFLRRLFGHG